MRIGQCAGVLVAAGATLLLGGCAPAAPPAPPATSSVASTPVAGPVVTTVAIGATAIELRDEQSTLATLPYAGDPAAAVAALTDAFGAEPVLSHRESDLNCVPEAEVVTWADGFVLRHQIPEPNLPAGQLFEVDSSTASVGDVAVVSSTGVAVGDPLDALTVGVPPERIGPLWEVDGGTVQFVDFEVGSGAYVAPDSPDYGSFDYWGAVGGSTDGVVDRLFAPTIFVNLC